ncbi:MAG: acetylglutamate kinase [Muribaculaceae bacterium]|nr:acetylglutamate kinase [Muribaculaceae bacterium]
MISVYKIGGNVINNPEELKKFLQDFSSIPGKKILVHGGGKEATELGKKTGLEAKMIDGRRVTDAETLKLVTMVYAGLINKRIVSMLQKYGCNAVGLTGADGNVIPAQRRNPSPIDFGYVGDINPENINTSFISLLLENGYVPVFCAICRNPEGGLLNCNADSIASAVAIACSNLEPTSLIYCFEKPGVLSDVEDDNSVIPLITPDMFNSLVESGKISGGMIPKVTNALKGVEAGIGSVRICSSKAISGKEGTTIQKERKQ